MSKPKTQAQLDKAADARLRKTYGVGLDWYNKTLKEQGGCAVCGDLGKTRRLNVDHDHRWVDVKIVSEKIGPGEWEAEAEYAGNNFFEYRCTTKSEAAQKIKARLKTASVRGLLCHRCNRALILLRDRPDLMRIATDYLEGFKNEPHHKNP